MFNKHEFVLCSPNICFKKFKIKKKVVLASDFKYTLKKNQFFLIVCCATPIVQENFIKFFIKNKKKTNFLMLEKPVSRHPKYFASLLNYSKKKGLRLE